MFKKFKKNNNDEITDYPNKKEFKKLEKLINTHQDYLNNIFVFHELESTPYLELMRSISYELLKFFDNVCEKYNLEYWLDFGTLLGAVRHEDFIPWDDDLDVGMMREDYYKFLEVFPEELEKSGLKYVKTQFKISNWDNGSKRWFQINSKRPEFNGKFVGIDVFPYDFITEFDDDYIERFHKLRPDFFEVWKDDVSLQDAINQTCSHLNLSLTKTDYFIAGVDGGRFQTGSIFKILKTEDLLPLKRIKFGKYEFLVPSNHDNYLKEIYGKKYMEIGKTIKDHNRLNRYKKQPNIISKLNESNNELLKANFNFK